MEYPIIPKRKEEKQRLEPIKDLLLKGINSKDENGNNVLMLIPKLDYRNYAYNNLVRWLVEHGISLDDTKILNYNYTDEIIDYLLDSGVNFDYNTIDLFQKYLTNQFIVSKK